MTPDWKEPDTNPVRPRPGVSTNSMDWDDESDLLDTPDVLGPFDDMASRTNALDDPDPTTDGTFTAMDDDDDDEDELSTSVLTRSELIRQWGQQLAPVLVPLLFGGLTFLLVLPFLLNGHAYVPLSRFWPIGLVIVALAILQGMGLYYAGSSNAYLMLGLVGGFFLFLLVGCFTLFGPLATVFLLLIVLAVSYVVWRKSVHQVKEGTVDIVNASGKYSRTLLPGLNFLLPWEKVVTTLNTREVQWRCPEQTVRISRDEDVLLNATVSYQLEPEDAHIAAMQVEKWEESLRDQFRIALQTVATELTPEDFLGWSHGFRSRQPAKPLNPVNPQQSLNDPSRWERINAILYQRMSDKVALWGVQINWVSVHDIMLVPHVYVPGSNAPAGAPPVSRGTPQQSPPQPSPVLQQAGASQPAQATGTGAKGAKGMDGARLVAAYDSVKKGVITDPATIRSIAARFEAVASDPEANAKAPFDAARCARNLYERADVYEMQQSMVGDFNDITRPDWNVSRPADDNLMAGG